MSTGAIDYLDAFEWIPVPATLIDGEGVIIDVNQAFIENARRRGIHLRKEDRVGLPVTDFGADEYDRRRFGEFVEKLLKGGGSQQMLWDGRGDDGRPFYAEIRAQVIPREEGVAGAVILRQDVTERVLRHQREELVRRLRDETWRIQDAGDMEPILVAVRDGLRGFGMPIATCAVNLIDVDADPLTVQFHNMTPEGRWRGSRSTGPEPTVVELWRRGGLAYRRDLSREDPLEESVVLQGITGLRIRSVVDLPFTRGTLAANSVEPDAFTEADLEVLGEMARVLGEGFDRLANLEALRSSEERYRATVRQSADAILLIDLASHRILETNPACQQLLGYDAAQLSDLTTYDVVAHDRDSIDSNARRVMERGEHVIGERQLRRHDGSLVDVEVSLSRISYGGSQVCCAMARDITRRKSDEFRRTVLQRLRDQVWQMESGRDIGKVLDLARDSLEAMGVAFDHFGINLIQKEERLPVRVYARGISQGYVGSPRTPMDSNSVVRWWRDGDPVYRRDLAAIDVYEERETIEAAFDQPVRSVLDVPFSHGTIAINSSEPDAFAESDIEAVQDVGEALSEGFRRTDDLARLANQREHLLVTLRSLGEGVISTDGSGLVEIANPAAEALTGWSEEELRGRALHEVFRVVHGGTGQPAESPVDRVLRTGVVVASPADTVLIDREGLRRLLVYSGAPIRDDRSRVVGVAIVFRDVTEQRRTEEELARSSKLESLGVLAGGIAHDFNNILTGIAGNLSLARFEVADENEHVDGLLESAEKAAHRAAQLTAQLLAFSHGGAPVRRVVSLGRIAEEAVAFALRGSNERSHFRLSQDLPSVYADSSQLAQVLHNLAINADQAMPTGGDLWVSADDVEIAESAGLSLPPGRYVCLAVRDAGVGMEPTVQERIFEPYFTTKERGSGLGLASVYTIVRNHEGHIAVESQVGAGSTFTIHLPAIDALSPDQEDDDAPAPRGSGHRLLVMDDEELIRQVLGAMLAKLGYDPVVTCHGEEAVSAYERAREAPRSPRSSST